MSTLQKVKGGHLYADWYTAIQNSQMRRIQWIFCPGHASVIRNERADKLAGDSVIEGDFTLDPPYDTVYCTRLPSQRHRRGFFQMSQNGFGICL